MEIEDCLKFGLSLALGYVIGINGQLVLDKSYQTNLESQNKQLKTQIKQLTKQLNEVKEVVSSW